MYLQWTVKHCPTVSVYSCIEMARLVLPGTIWGLHFELLSLWPSQLRLSPVPSVLPSLSAPSLLCLHLKDKFTPKWIFSHYLPTLMLMESQVKFCTAQNISGASQWKGDAKKQKNCLIQLVQLNPSLLEPRDSRIDLKICSVYSLVYQPQRVR